MCKFLRLFLIVFTLSCLKLYSTHVIDGQKLLRAYVCCYILSCRLLIKFLILSYLILCYMYSTKINLLCLCLCTDNLVPEDLDIKLSRKSTNGEVFVNWHGNAADVRLFRIYQKRFLTTMLTRIYYYYYHYYYHNYYLFIIYLFQDQRYLFM